MVIPPGNGASQSSFPEVGGTTAWPMNPAGSRFVLPAVLYAVAALLALGGISILISGAEHFVTVLGACGFLIVALGVLLLGLSSGVHGMRKGAGVRHRNDAQGAGVVISSRQQTTVLLLLLGGVAVYGVSAWRAWKLGFGDELLPLSRDNSGAATVVLILAVAAAVLFVFFVVIYTRWTVELNPHGVRRVMSSPILRLHKEIAVDWDDIAAVTPTTVRTSAQTGERPMIELHLRTPRPEVQHRQWDAVDHIAIPAYLLATEPNTLLVVLQFLKDHPDQRGLLTRPDAPSWFTPRGTVGPAV
ncbi:hypothetical protein [Nocardia sp. NPDC056100]|uniref:hypothetical protein n=1 Tax=Nocardia sp. NPDC056100 TaxID=3345712 RepID=UPI0035DFD6D9